MLTLAEAGLALNAYKIFSVLNILPIHVDLKNGRIQRQSNKLRVFVWKLLFGFGVVHWFYIFGRLIQSTVVEPEKYFRWQHFVFHFGATGFYACFYFTGFRLFLKNPEETTMIFNHCFGHKSDWAGKMRDELKPESEHRNPNQLQGNKTRTGSGSGRGSSPESRVEVKGHKKNQVTRSHSDSQISSHPRPLLTWPSQYSLDELVAKEVPAAGLFTGFLVILILAVDRSRPQLLYTFLPPEYQNSYSFAFLLAVESLSLTVVFVIANFTFFSQIMFFGKCQLELKKNSLRLRDFKEKFHSRSVQGEEIWREIWTLRQIVKEMRELVVFIELFNRCFPFCILSWKIFSLAFTILFYFFAIRHYEEFPLLAVFAGYCAATITLIYIIMYEHAFSIPGKIDGLKQEFLLTAQKTGESSLGQIQGPGPGPGHSHLNRNLQADLKREMGRIQKMGVKVGSFYTLERESTPNFIDFVLRNVVSLLVSFPR